MKMKVTKSGVPVRAGRRDYHAVCQECDFDVMSRNGMGVGVQHAKRTGHEVWVDIEQLIVFNPGERWK